MVYVTQEHYIDLVIHNQSLPGGVKHPDYIDLSQYSFTCWYCGGSYYLAPDGTEVCYDCGCPLGE